MKQVQKIDLNKILKTLDERGISLKAYKNRLNPTVASKRISLCGIAKGNFTTHENIEEAKRIWTSQ
ncbi:MAG TPA: hypothetical protein ENI73_08955 [Spirochaetes bacterium]|nr:hypothetical protein [Spirochaetota bacterium]